MDTPRINLNAASEHELTQLPRIGVDTARRIVHHRATRKGFRDWADFAETLGRSDADVDAIKSRAWIGPRPEQVNTAANRRRAVREPMRARPPDPRGHERGSLKNAASGGESRLRQKGQAFK